MPRNEECELSRRERQIMDVIFAAGKATAAEVVETLPDNLSNSTVRTLLRILVEKGHLTKKLDGPRYIYRSKRSRPKAAQIELKRVVETFFAGSVEQAVAGLLQSPDLALNDDELDRLGRMIERARKEGR
ncbi:MAG: BlaI/MecI/CopY family transcriptional regulator [Pirellulaceae bacterium]